VRKGKRLRKWVARIYCYYKRFSKIINSKCAWILWLSPAEITITRTVTLRTKGDFSSVGQKGGGKAAWCPAIVHFVNGN